MSGRRENENILTLIFGTIIVTSVLVVGTTAVPSVASAETLSASVIGEEDIKNGEAYQIQVTGNVDASCVDEIKIIERDSAIFNSNEQLKTVPVDGEDYLSGDLDATITVDSDGAWDQDGTPDDGAEIRVKVTYIPYSVAPCGSGPSTEFSTMEINPADSEEPEVRKDVIIPDRVQTGETFAIDVVGTNQGGDAGEFNAMQIEFPGFTEQADGQYVGDPTGSAGQHVRIAPGDELGTANGGTATADYWQTELAFGPDQLYKIGANGGQLRVDLTAPPRDRDNDGVNNGYVLEVRTRVTLTDDTDQSVYFSAPDDDTEDDQGHNVEVHTVYVEGSDEAPDQPEDYDGYQDGDGVPENPRPSVSLGDSQVSEDGSETLTADANDPEGESLSYDWSVSGDGTISGSGSSVTYEAPTGISEDTSDTVSVTVYEQDQDKSAQASATVTVQNKVSNDDPDGDGIPNSDDECDNTPEDNDGYEDSDGCPENPAPSVSLSGSQVTEGESTTLTVDANDPEGESLTYDWSLSGDGSLSESGQSVTYEAPSDISSDTSATVSVTVSEQDERKSAQNSATVTVMDNDKNGNVEGPVVESDRDNDDRIGFTDLRHALQQYNRNNFDFTTLRRVLRLYNTNNPI